MYHQRAASQLASQSDPPTKLSPLRLVDQAPHRNWLKFVCLVQLSLICRAGLKSSCDWLAAVRYFSLDAHLSSTLHLPVLADAWPQPVRQADAGATLLAGSELHISLDRRKAQQVYCLKQPLRAHLMSTTGDDTIVSGACNGLWPVTFNRFAEPR